jgi:hypothetical protein
MTATTHSPHTVVPTMMQSLQLIDWAASRLSLRTELVEKLFAACTAGWVETKRDAGKLITVM